MMDKWMDGWMDEWMDGWFGTAFITFATERCRESTTDDALCIPRPVDQRYNSLPFFPIIIIIIVVVIVVVLILILLLLVIIIILFRPQSFWGRWEQINDVDCRQSFVR